MGPSKSGQGWAGYTGLIFIGLIVGILYMWVFQRPFLELFFIIPLAIIGTAAIFALFIIAINYFYKQ
jgi:hypothetical protein